MMSCKELMLAWFWFFPPKNAGLLFELGTRLKLLLISKVTFKSAVEAVCGQFSRSYPGNSSKSFHIFFRNTEKWRHKEKNILAIFIT